MGEETARLRREIDRTRDDLTRDVDLISEKTSPSRIVERRVERTRRGIAGLRDRVMGRGDDVGMSRDRYPGGAFVGSAGGDRYDDEYGNQYGDQYGDRYGEQTGDWSRATDPSGPTMSERAKGAVQGVQGTAHDTVRGARQQAEGNPLAAGLVAFGVGWLVSSILPASDAEVSAARRAQEAAGEHGGPIAEQARQAATEIGDDLRSSAQEAVEQVKGHAQDAAQAVRDEGATAVRTVRAEGVGAEGTPTSAGPAPGGTT